MFSLKIGPECSLRSLANTDATELFSLVDSNRKDLRNWLGWLDHNKSVGDSGRYIQQICDQENRNDGLQTGIWYKSKLAGIIGFHEVAWTNRKTSMGYWLGSNYQGNGLIT